MGKRVLAAIVLLVAITTATPAAPLKAPDFNLTGIDGKSVTLSRLKGNVVLLDFWATWCPPCREEIPGFVELHKRYGKQGLVVIGLSLDQGSRNEVAEFAKRMKINYPVALATEEVVRSYGGVHAIPTTFLISRRGEIVKRYVGYQKREVFETDINTALKEKRLRATVRETMFQGSPVGDVLAQGQPVLCLRNPAGGLTPRDRARLVAGRLNRALESGLTWRDLRVANRNGETVVLAGTMLLVTADRAEARSNRTSPDELARMWRDRLVSALDGKTPALSRNSSALIVALER
jgi:peroxiredoxin